MKRIENTANDIIWAVEVKTSRQRVADCWTLISGLRHDWKVAYFAMGFSLVILPMVFLPFVWALIVAMLLLVGQAVAVYAVVWVIVARPLWVELVVKFHTIKMAIDKLKSEK